MPVHDLVQAKRQARWARNTVAAATRRQLATDLVAWVRDLDGGSLRCRAQQAAVIESTTSLVGPMVAAKLLGEVGEIRRFPTKEQLAAHTGTAPLEASWANRSGIGCHGPGPAGATMLGRLAGVRATVTVTVPWRAPATVGV